jgi:hypothetical protein
MQKNKMFFSHLCIWYAGIVKNAGRTADIRARLIAAGRHSADMASMGRALLVRLIVIIETYELSFTERGQKMWCSRLPCRVSKLVIAAITDRHWLAAAAR